jgi:hypothetical protein
MSFFMQTLALKGIQTQMQKNIDTLVEYETKAIEVTSHVENKVDRCNAKIARMKGELNGSVLQTYVDQYEKMVELLLDPKTHAALRTELVEDMNWIRAEFGKGTAGQAGRNFDFGDLERTVRERVYASRAGTTSSRSSTHTITTEEANTSGAMRIR